MKRRGKATGGGYEGGRGRRLWKAKRESGTGRVGMYPKVAIAA